MKRQLNDGNGVKQRCTVTLTLARETLRILTRNELSPVVGGGGAGSAKEPPSAAFAFC
jgi:hypothetical protein